MKNNTHYTYTSDFAIHQNTKKPILIWLENEMIITDQFGIPCGDIVHDLLSTLNLKSAKKELDHCQIELYNPKPHTTIENCINEIVETFTLIKNEVEKRGFKILNKVVPDSYDEPKHSWEQAHYQPIHDELINLGIRTSTNIAWLHLNISNGNNISQFAKTSNHVSKLINNNLLSAIWATQDRFDHIKKVTNGINLSPTLKSMMWLNTVDYVPYMFTDTNNHDQILNELYENEILHRDWSAIKSYRFVRMKWHIDDTIITEIRTLDAWFSEETITLQANKALELYLAAQEQE